MRVSIWLYILEQSATSAAMLCALSACLRLTPWWGRITAVSAACGACAALLADASPILRLTALVSLSSAAPLLALPGLPRRLRPQTALTALLLSLLASGLSRLMLPLTLPGASVVCLVCLALACLPRALPRPAELPHLAMVDVRCGPHRVTLTALIDTGNLLRDPATGTPVVIISRVAAMRLGRSHFDPEGMRLLPVRTVSGLTVMPVFRPDAVRLQCDSVWRTADCLIGVSPDGGEGFQALVPAVVLSSDTA